MEEVVNTISGDINQNSALIIFWLVIFQLVFALIVFWLSNRIRNTSSARAITIAEESQVLVNASKAKIDSLDLYIRESFSKDFSGAMDSFDKTTTSVLNELKDEMLQGVKRIEQIEIAVTKKGQLQDKVERGQDDIQRLIGSPEEKLIEPEQPAVEETSEEPAKT